MAGLVNLNQGTPTPDLPTNIVPTNIAWLRLSGEFPMDMRIPLLWIKITLESNMKSTMWTPVFVEIFPFLQTSKRKWWRMELSIKSDVSSFVILIIFVSFHRSHSHTFCHIRFHQWHSSCSWTISWKRRNRTRFPIQNQQGSARSTFQRGNAPAAPIQRNEVSNC